MVKHNNEIPHAHFKKDWKRNVITWFNQPGRKLRRRNNRAAKAKAVAPRPLQLLRPVVRCPTNKYNAKVRQGRGFTLDELKAAGVSRHEALSIGISIDYRRRNLSEGAFQDNVERLKLYMSKLVLFPRNPTSKRAKKGDATKAELAAATQNMSKAVLPINKSMPRLQARMITPQEKNTVVTEVLRKALTDGKLWGQRMVRQKAKEDAKKQAALKKKK
jgi:large subunit ribosomal protein L13e